jgi:molybdopterin converting factor small subunit
MRVTVKLYGPFSLMSGRNEFAIEADEDTISVEDFLSLLGRKLPQLRRSIKNIEISQFLKQRILLVINGVPCSNKLESIQNGDMIKILTRVTGG